MTPLGVILAAVVACGGIDDTAAIQAAVDAGDVELLGSCVVRGQPGIRVPSNRKVTAYGATIQQTANVGGSGVAGRNRILETVPGASNIQILGGRWIGSRAAVVGLQWGMGIRVDSASDVLVQDVVIEDCYTDGLTIGGNMPGSTRVCVRNARISHSKRNGLSVTCGTYIYIESSVFENVGCHEGGAIACTPFELNMPRAGVDIEPSAGEKVDHVRVTDSVARGNEKSGFFVQAGQGIPGSDYLLDNVRAENNDSPVAEAQPGIGIVVNQLDRVTVRNCVVMGGDIGFSFGAGLRDLTFLNSEVFGTLGNGINFAGVVGVTSKGIKLNGRPVAYPLGGVSGDVNMKAFE